MSIPFLDQSDYLRDMEELDDLMPAVKTDRGAEADTRDEYDIVEEKPQDPLGKTGVTLSKHALTPRSADDFIPSHFAEEVSREALVPCSSLPEATDDGWGDKKACNGEPRVPSSKTWFGSGGKAPESEDEVKKGLLARIEAYRTTWPWLDEKITFPANLHKKTPEKLKAILEECSNKVQNKNMTSMLGIVFSTAICAIENLCTKQFGWTDLKGFALECETDETIKNSIKEIEIKYFASSKAMAPEARLAIALLQKLVAVTNRNRSQRLLEEVARRPLDDCALQGYADL